MKDRVYICIIILLLISLGWSIQNDNTDAISVGYEKAYKAKMDLEGYKTGVNMMGMGQKIEGNFSPETIGNVAYVIFSEKYGESEMENYKLLVRDVIDDNLVFVTILQKRPTRFGGDLTYAFSKTTLEIVGGWTGE